jgi:anti-sigma regulatory factor (Ser/Thr protein kinase)
MQSDRSSATNGRPSSVKTSESTSDLNGLRAECRRQAQAIGALSDAVDGLRRGARALKAENAELRADAERLRQRRAGGPAGGHGDGGRWIEARIALDLYAPGAARVVVADCLGDRVAASTLENAQLLVSELVTNSVRHSGMAGGADVIVSVDLTPGMVRLDVEDPGHAGTVAPHAPDTGTGGGYGLNLVEALSERWGLERVAQGGTRVWAQLALVP